MSAKNTRILGIDPGLETTGFGVIEGKKGKEAVLDFGVFLTKKEDEIAERLRQIATDFTEIMEKWKPEIVAFEKLVFVKNVTNGLRVAEARGVMLALAAQHGAKIVEFLPTKVKSNITGNGRADKEQVQNMVQHLLQLPQRPEPDDAADALAIALTAVANIRFE